MTFAAAPLDAHARRVLVAWLGAWFAGVAGLLVWSVPTGSLAALAGAAALGTALPAAVLARLAGFPSAYELHGDVLRVRRHLLPDRAFPLRRPVARDTRAGALRRRGGPLASAYGCRSLAWPKRRSAERLHVAATDLGRAVRVGTGDAAVLVTPEDPDAFVRAVRDIAPGPPSHYRRG